MDWYHQGMVAATEGYTLKQGKTPFIDKCQEDQGIAMDSVAFERGFKAGLNKICTPEGLKALADKGIKYQETCENDDDSPLRQVPSQESVLKTKIGELEEEVARLKTQNSELEAELTAVKAKPCSKE